MLTAAWRKLDERWQFYLRLVPANTVKVNGNTSTTRMCEARMPLFIKMCNSLQVNVCDHLSLIESVIFSEHIPRIRLRGLYKTHGIKNVKLINQNKMFRQTYRMTDRLRNRYHFLISYFQGNFPIGQLPVDLQKSVPVLPANLQISVFSLVSYFTKINSQNINRSRVSHIKCWLSDPEALGSNQFVKIWLPLIQSKSLLTQFFSWEVAD